MARFAGLQDPVTMDFENSTIAYCVDAIAISMGALMGTSPVTTFVESATGIRGKINMVSIHNLDLNFHAEGGKTGITGMVTGLAFFVSVFFAPIFSSIPGWATGGALVFVGSSMMRKYVLTAAGGLMLTLYFQCTRDKLGLCRRRCACVPSNNHNPSDVQVRLN